MSNFFALYPAEFVKVALDKVLASLKQTNNFNDIKSDVIIYSTYIIELQKMMHTTIKYRYIEMNQILKIHLQVGGGMYK